MATSFQILHNHPILQLCIYLHNKQVLVAWLVGWLVGDNLPLRNFGPYGIILINVCAAITVAMVMLLRDYGPYGIIFMNVFTTLDFPIIRDRQFTSITHI
jgi:hypothetical protein